MVRKKKRFFNVPSSNLSCAVHVKMEDVKESKQSGHPQNLWDYKMDQLQNLLTWKENF